MTQLIHLVRSNRLEGQVLFQGRQIFFTAGQKCNTGAGKSDFGGGAELEQVVHRAVFVAQVSYGQQR